MQPPAPAPRPGHSAARVFDRWVGPSGWDRRPKSPQNCAAPRIPRVFWTSPSTASVAVAVQPSSGTVGKFVRSTCHRVHSCMHQGAPCSSPCAQLCAPRGPLLAEKAPCSLSSPQKCGKVHCQTNMTVLLARHRQFEVVRSEVVAVDRDAVHLVHHKPEGVPALMRGCENHGENGVLGQTQWLQCKLELPPERFASGTDRLIPPTSYSFCSLDNSVLDLATRSGVTYKNRRPADQPDT